MYILHNVLWTYPIVITSCLLIKSFFRWRSLPLYSWLKSIIFWWYCEERLDASHSVGSLRWEKLFSFRYRVPFKKMPWNAANRYHWATCCILRQNWKKKIDTLIGDKQFRTQPKAWSAPPVAAHSSPPQQWLHVYAYHLSGCPNDFLVIVGQNLNNQHTAVKRS